MQILDDLMLDASWLVDSTAIMATIGDVDATGEVLKAKEPRII